jgi:RNA recognition motif-containing protein
MEGGKLYVGNLNYSVTSEELQKLFADYGMVKEVKIVERRGFAFVEMSDLTEAEKAIEALNGSVFKGRAMKVDKARPRLDKPRRGFRRY